MYRVGSGVRVERWSLNVGQTEFEGHWGQKRSEHSALELWNYISNCGSIRFENKIWCSCKGWYRWVTEKDFSECQELEGWQLARRVKGRFFFLSSYFFFFLPWIKTLNFLTSFNHCLEGSLTGVSLHFIFRNYPVNNKFMFLLIPSPLELAKSQQNFVLISPVSLMAVSLLKKSRSQNIRFKCNSYSLCVSIIWKPLLSCYRSCKRLSVLT